VLLGVIRLRGSLREHTVLAAAHPCGVLPGRLLLPLCRGILSGDHDYQIISARRVLFVLDHDLPLQALSRSLLLVPVSYPCLIYGEMMEIFVFLGDQQLSPVI
jgi:hypothetical protein